MNAEMGQKRDEDLVIPITITHTLTPPNAVGPVNLNTYVKFKMKPQGVEVARKYWEQVTTFPNAAFPVDQPGVETRQQFHELFRIFGGQNMGYDGGGSPIYDLIIEPMPS